MPWENELIEYELMELDALADKVELDRIHAKYGS